MFVSALVLDLFSRHIAGWSLGEQITSENVIDALRMAWLLRYPDRSELILHSDRGASMPATSTTSCSRNPELRLDEP
jgi:putative transposase